MVCAKFASGHIVVVVVVVLISVRFEMRNDHWVSPSSFSARKFNIVRFADSTYVLCPYSSLSCVCVARIEIIKIGTKNRKISKSPYTFATTFFRWNISFNVFSYVFSPFLFYFCLAFCFFIMGLLAFSLVSFVHLFHFQFLLCDTRSSFVSTVTLASGVYWFRIFFSCLACEGLGWFRS